MIYKILSWVTKKNKLQNIFHVYLNGLTINTYGESQYFSLLNSFFIYISVLNISSMLSLQRISFTIVIIVLLQSKPLWGCLPCNVSGLSSR